MLARTSLLLILTSVFVEPNEELEAKTTSRAVAAYNKLYHLFENDREIALKQRKLEESDRQMDSDLGQLEAAATAAKPSSTGSASFGAANLSLKHLLATIEAKKESLSLTDYELKNLILDVRKNRSKWASEDKIGQEELYEAAEKVVLELRGYTEHSTAFLNKVNKRDAPNYFTIIKHPMDLNTVMKKLKSFQYKSKKEFVADLMLIWKNCLTYNTDPKHFLRAHAIAMQKKTLSLIPLIPDITVRDRADVEAEEAAAAAAAAGSGDAQAQDEEEGTRGGKHAAKGRKRKVGETEEHHEPVAETPDSKKPSVSGHVALTLNVGTPAQARASPALASIAAATGTNSTPTPGPDLETELKETLEEESRDQESADVDVEQKVWQAVYTKPRSLYCVRRADIFRNGKLHPDAPAPTRTSEAMGRFADMISQLFRRPRDEDSLIARRFRANGGSTGFMDALEKDDEKAKFIVEYETTSGLPVVPWAISADNDRDDELPPNLQISDIKTSGYVLKPGGLGEKITHNLTEMQQIRKICSKIELIRQMQQENYVPSASISEAYGQSELKDRDLDLESRLPNRDKFDSEASAAAMRRAVARVAMHSGFESSQMIALDALSEIASSYLSKLARSFKGYLEKSDSADMTQEGMVLAALRQHGISGVAALESYVHDDVERHGVKLQGLKRKLAAFMGELLRPATDQEFSDRQFTDDSEQFLNGDFSQVLGDDFFGFRELGLDKELGLLTESVPFHLLRRRLQANAATEDSIPEHVDRVLTVPEYPPMDRNNASTQIGILISFFIAKIDGNGGKPLVEVEQLPQKQRVNRAKLAPTGKVLGTRKKPLARAFIRQPPVAEPDIAEEEKAIEDGIDKALKEFDDAFM
jgi:transcriptional activator SPT7